MPVKPNPSYLTGAQSGQAAAAAKRKARMILAAQKSAGSRAQYQDWLASWMAKAKAARQGAKFRMAMGLSRHLTAKDKGIQSVCKTGGLVGQINMMITQNMPGTDGPAMSKGIGVWAKYGWSLKDICDLACCLYMTGGAGTAYDPGNSTPVYMVRAWTTGATPSSVHQFVSGLPVALGSSQCASFAHSSLKKQQTRSLRSYGGRHGR